LNYETQGKLLQWCTQFLASALQTCRGESFGEQTWRAWAWSDVGGLLDAR